MYNSIEFSSVSKIYRQPSLLPWKSKKIQALSDTSFVCPKGKITCLLGPNGAGKTTIIKIIAGLIYHDAGSVAIDGKIVEMDSSDSHRKIGIMTPNDRSFYWRLTGRQNLDFFCSLGGYHGREKKEMLENIFDELDFTEDADKPYRLYSTGMKQKLLLARALVGKPEILLLDEPTAHIDPLARENIYRLITNVFIKKKKMSILLCTHDLAEAANLSDHVILLNKGSVLEQGSYSQLANLLREDVRIHVEFAGAFRKKYLTGTGADVIAQKGSVVTIRLESREDIPDLIKTIVMRGGKIASCSAGRESLLEIYTRLAGGDA